MRKTSLGLLLAAALISQPVLADTTIATVNGVAIPQSRMDTLAEEIAAKGMPVNAAMQEKIKERLIMNEVVRQEAIRKGLDKNPAYLARLDQIKDQLLVGTLYEDFVKANPVPEAAVKKEYDKIKVSMGGKEYRVRHILVDNESTAKDLIAQLKKGAKFEDLAKAHSKDPGSAPQGGELGWAAPDSYTPAFAEAIKKMPKGKITDTPLKTGFGWHVIKVEDIRASKGPSYPEIKEDLTRQMQGEALQKYVESLVAKAKITK